MVLFATKYTTNNTVVVLVYVWHHVIPINNVKYKYPLLKCAIKYRLTLSMLLNKAKLSNHDCYTQNDMSNKCKIRTNCFVYYHSF